MIRRHVSGGEAHEPGGTAACDLQEREPLRERRAVLSSPGCSTGPTASPELLRSEQTLVGAGCSSRCSQLQQVSHCPTIYDTQQCNRTHHSACLLLRCLALNSGTGWLHRKLFSVEKPVISCRMSGTCIYLGSNTNNPQSQSFYTPSQQEMFQSSPESSGMGESLMSAS